MRVHILIPKSESFHHETNEKNQTELNPQTGTLSAMQSS